VPLDSLPLPTDAELALLRILWRLGPSTVREIHEDPSIDRALAYTTVLKTLQVMLDKHLVTRDASERSHRYAPAVPQEHLERGLTADLLERGFGGSVERLILRALGRERATDADLAKIRALIQDFRTRRDRK